MPVDNPQSHVSHENILKTCQKCHQGATRKFAGYFTHATHHDPVKYPILYWTFRGMTGLLVVTFLFAGIHTLLWLPRSLQWRKELKARHNSNADKTEKEDDDNDEMEDEKT